MTTITVDFSSFDDLTPIPGSWTRTTAVTKKVQCDDITIAPDGSETRCNNSVFVDPGWLDWQKLWPVRVRAVLCPDCST